MFAANLWNRTLLIAFLVIGCPAIAEEQGALINALIRKGILTAQEAEDIQAEVMRESRPGSEPVRPAGKSTERLSIGMRLQLQYAHLDTDVDGATSGPPATDRAFLRRMYLTLKARLNPQWSAVVTYDFSSAGYDDAIIEWTPGNDLSFNFGLRKVNVGYEERASSGDLKSIERSGVTRYFVEPENGRRLGAASYRIGAFLDGIRSITDTLELVYSAAITNPERIENFEIASSSGNGGNNQPALWATVGLRRQTAKDRSWLVGIGAGRLPDQGGRGFAEHGRGLDLTLTSLHAQVTAGRLGFMGEYLRAEVEGGGGAGADAGPEGFFLQPSVFLTPNLEGVVRYEWLDTDGHGVQLPDVVRSAPAAPLMDRFEGWYAGANWYLSGNDLKYQLGVAYGKTRDGVDGAPAEAKTIGVRSQFQMQF